MNKLVFLPLLALLAACSKPLPGEPPASTPVTPAKPGAHVGESWELVMLKRSDPPNIMTVVEREVSYTMCVDLARLRNRPVKPFPPIPDDYEDERVTRITNGVSTVVVSEWMTGEDPKLDMEGDCSYRLKTARTKIVEISHAGKKTTITDGKVTETEDIPPWPEHAPRGKSTSDYSVDRTVNGVRMRCLPPTFWTQNTNDTLDSREMCVYYLDNVMVDESGDPVHLRSHVMVKLFPKFPYMSKDEPQSMRRIEQNEPDPYLVSTWTK
ncbi:MAG TPA: hypothetical protein VFS95_14555 [Telluria sp.]|nr:hypothetical protein [Telluria sp.]